MHAPSPAPEARPLPKGEVRTIAKRISLLVLWVGRGCGIRGAGIGQGFDLQFYRHQLFAAVTSVDTAHGWYVGVVAAYGYSYMTLVHHASVGRIETGPS